MAAPKKKVEKDVPGNVLQVMNMSDNENFCVATRRKLPRNGFVWANGDDWFINRQTAKNYYKQKEAGEAS